MRGRYAGVGGAQQMFHQAINEVKSGSIAPEHAAHELDLSLGGLNGGIEDFDYRSNGNGIEATVMWEEEGDTGIQTVEGLPDAGATHHLFGILYDTERIGEDRDEYRAQKYLESLKEEGERAFDALLEQDVSKEVESYLEQTGRSIAENKAGNRIISQCLDDEQRIDVYAEIGTISFIYNELFNEIGQEAQQKFRNRYGQHKTPRFEQDTVALEAKQLNQATNAGTKDFRYIFQDTDDGKKYRGIARHTGQNDQDYKWA